LDSLLPNALEYGGGEPVRGSAEEQRDQARIQVADHGIAVPARKRERISNFFEPADVKSKRC